MAPFRQASVTGQTRRRRASGVDCEQRNSSANQVTDIAWNSSYCDSPSLPLPSTRMCLLVSLTNCFRRLLIWLSLLLPHRGPLSYPAFSYHASPFSPHFPFSTLSLSLIVLPRSLSFPHYQSQLRLSFPPTIEEVVLIQYVVEQSSCSSSRSQQL